MLKRTFDLLFSIFALLLSCPLFVIIAIYIKINSTGPIFYRGIRIGRFGNSFRIFKFRTMVINAEELGGPSTLHNDPRFIRGGKFLRKYKLDELPQLFNILLGQMSIVGPRPQVENYTRLYSQDEQIMLSVKPGLTDYASLKFINLDEILGNYDVDNKYLREIEPEKNRLRIEYAKHNSFWIDLVIILKTLKQLLKILNPWNTKD